MKPTLQGFSHLGLSVPEMAPVRDTLVEVLDFEVIADTDEYCLLVHRGGEFALALTDHGGAVDGPFDERRAGLDHLALAVADPQTLADWYARISGAGLTVSPVVDSDAGQHLNFRLPGGVPVELFVMGDGFRGELGLDVGDEAATARAG